MRNAITTLFLAVLAGNACAAWTVTDVGTDGTVTSYIDLATLRQSQGTMKMWTMMDYTERQTMGNDAPFLSSVTLYEFDCKEERMRALSLSAYSGNMGDGNTTVSFDNASQWSYVKPGTINAGRFRIACKRTALK